VALRKTLVDPLRPAPVRTDWRHGLVALSDDLVTLREVRTADARSLAEHLYDPDLLRYIAPCPSTAAGFRRFIQWAHAERRRRSLACYGIVPKGYATAVGVIQVWAIERDFSTAEWGFVVGKAFGGTGLFTRAARLLLDEVFTNLGVHRLEARAVDANVAGTRALERLGARREGILRGGFHDGHAVHDHVMWSILAPEWLALRGRERHAH
jgi:RimJ/RimL family protein N-acetyltransferase